MNEVCVLVSHRYCYLSLLRRTHRRKNAHQTATQHTHTHFSNDVSLCMLHQQISIDAQATANSQPQCRIYVLRIDKYNLIHAFIVQLLYMKYTNSKHWDTASREYRNRKKRRSVPKSRIDEIKMYPKLIKPFTAPSTIRRQSYWPGDLSADCAPFHPTSAERVAQRNPENRRPMASPSDHGGNDAWRLKNISRTSSPNSYN